MNYDDAIDRIYRHLENDDIEAAVMGCLRVARHAKDYVNAANFLRELYPNQKAVIRALYEDLSPLKDEARKFLFEKSFEHYSEIHALDPSLSFEVNGEKATLLLIAAGEINAEIRQLEGSIADMTLPSNMDPFDAAAFTDRYTRDKSMYRLRIKAILTIKSRLKAYCLNYAIQIERQLATQRQSQGLLDAVQNDVNNYFKARSDDVYFKLEKSAQLSASPDTEDASLLLTEVRRALKAAADYFYPPVDGKVTCSDGIERTLDEDRYMNRLQEFLAASLSRSTAKELLQSELDHLVAFMRRLNEIASKGVHSSATLAEAKQGLVSVYFFLFNVIQHTTHKQ